MFNDIGGKIKTLAVVVCWLGIIASLILGIVLIGMDDDLTLIGIIVMLFGALGSWLGSFVAYGYGELIDNTDAAQYDTKEIVEKLNIYLPRLIVAAETIARKEDPSYSAPTTPPQAAPNVPFQPMQQPAAPVVPNYDAPPVPHLVSKRCNTCGMVVNSNASAPATHCPNCGSVIM